MTEKIKKENLDTVYIQGNAVTLLELNADVRAAVEKGLSGKWAFMPETVDALLKRIDFLMGDKES